MAVWVKTRVFSLAAEMFLDIHSYLTSTICTAYKHKDNRLLSNSASPRSCFSPPCLFFLPCPRAEIGWACGADLLWISQECIFIRGLQMHFSFPKCFVSINRNLLWTRCSKAKPDAWTGGLSQQRPATVWTTPRWNHLFKSRTPKHIIASWI